MMIPYNNISYLTHSESGLFDSYIGHMDMNKHMVSDVQNEFVQEGTNFLAVSVHTRGRETTVFHICPENVSDLKDLEPSEEIDSCSVCQESGSLGASLWGTTFTKSATFHNMNSLCQSCISEFKSALDYLGDSTLESKVLSHSL